MKIVLQRVKSSTVSVENRVIASIGKGLLLLLGIDSKDDGSEIPWLAKKVTELRIFPDETGKMNLSIRDVGGEILLISQFTLSAQLERGRRPDFFTAAEPAKAEAMYEEFAREVAQNGVEPKLGSFGAYMEVELVNDGPVTFILER